jgi:tetratricopeptide (TPR) repeat protein
MSQNHDHAMFQLLSSCKHWPAKTHNCTSRLFVGLCSVGLLFSCQPGCQALQKRALRRSAQCEALCAQARAAREAGNTDQANECLNAAIRQHPSDLETRRQLGETMWNSGRKVEALQEFTALRELYPNDARLASRLAVMEWESNQRLAASKTAIDALSLDPQSKEAWLIRARAEAERGELDDALASYLRLSQIVPNDLNVQLELGELHLKRGHPDRACPLFRAAMIQPHATPQQKVDAEWRLAIAYAKCDRLAESTEIMERLIVQRQSTADDWCFLGWTRMQSGDVAGAQAALKQAEEVEPDSLAVRRFSRQLRASSQSASHHQAVTPASDLAH